MTLERVLDAGDAQFLVRDGTLDWENVEEYDSGHWAACDFRPGDRWLDAGAQIGTFSVYAARRCEHIVAFEPDEDNFRMLFANLRLNGIENVTAVRAALVGNDDASRPFYVEPRKNKGTHSLIKVEQRFIETTVPCANISNVLWEHKINCVEMDVEGAELELVRAVENWDPIRQLHLEFHNYVLRDHSGALLAEVMRILGAAFDDVRFDETIQHPLWKIIVARKEAQ